MEGRIAANTANVTYPVIYKSKPSTHATTSDMESLPTW